MRWLRTRAGSIAIALAIACVGSVAIAQTAPPSPGYPGEDESWRFNQHDRRVKVVLLAGSIGAFRNRPYGALIHQWCANVEVRNLSVVGAGAPQLYTRLQNDVLENPTYPRGARHLELWLLFGGGLNSVAGVTRTNFAMNRMFRLAHRRGLRVAAMTLTPWGEDGTDDERWRGGRALHSLRATRRVVDYVMGRSTPEEALGPFAQRRPRGVAPSDPWTPAERPDVAIDLYDAPALRDAEASPWPLDDVRQRIERDPRWRTETARLSAEARAARLEADARFLSNAPRFFWRSTLRGFDHIHPNREGHETIARVACPQLPPSWGCRCP
ncbi:MAG: hypothetical protein KF729_28815 [Sandaracinaceae bacterium]|nr:hypothetical protein [Sandaracinaceae bacterium]